MNGFCYRSIQHVKELDEAMLNLKDVKPVILGSKEQLEQLKDELYISPYKIMSDRLKTFVENIEKENDNMKEIKTQKVVDLYFNREIEKTLIKFENKEEEILNLDPLYSVLKGKLAGINLSLSENGYNEINLNLKQYTDNKTDGLLGKLNMENVEEQEELLNKKDEVIVMLSACDTYEQEMEVLKSYGIIDNGKLSK